MASLRLLILGLFLVFGVSGYDEGAPLTTCFTQYPHHSGTQFQKSASPFTISMDHSNYIPGQEIKITVTDSTGQAFQGIQMSARRTVGNTDEIVGRFVGYPTDKLKVFNCYNGIENMITHRNSRAVTSLTIKWRAPAKNVGKIVFRSTLLRSYNVFWYDVMTELPVNPIVTEPIQPSPNILPPVSIQPITIDFESCGRTQGCFFYPKYCSSASCTATATYRLNNVTGNYDFELYVNKDVDYVTLGFSGNTGMGDDWTITCTGRQASALGIQEGYNRGYDNERYMDVVSMSRAVQYVDGKIACRFTLPATFSIYDVHQGTEPTTTIPWNLGDRQYLMLAWGYVLPDSTVIKEHSDHPPVSGKKVDLSANEITYSSAFHVMVKLHAILMTVAWILLAGLVTVVSRHYRDWLPRTRLCGTQVWFQIHRELALLITILTGVGLLLIFLHFGSTIRKYATPHAYVGLAVTACVGVQVIAGFLRPGPDSKMRPLFAWGHRFLGHAQHILAAVTMFLAYDIEYINPSMRKYGFIVLGVWVAVQILWHIVFEVLSRRQGPHAKSESYSMDDLSAKTGEGKNDSRSYSFILAVYVLCLLGITVAAAIAVLLEYH